MCGPYNCQTQNLTSLKYFVGVKNGLPYKYTNSHVSLFHAFNNERPLYLQAKDGLA